MKAKSFLFVLILVSTFSIAQESSLPNPGMYNKLSRNFEIFNPKGGLNIRQQMSSKDNGIQGSKYLFSAWDGNYIIQSTKGMRYNLNSLNYNLETKKMESMLSKDSIFELRTGNIDFVTANNKKYKIINEELFQELNTGKFKVYKQFNIKVQEAFVNPMTKAESTPAQYVQVGKYFYYKNDVLVPLKLNKKEVLAMLNSKENEVKKFASDKDFSFSEEADVVKIVNYYNTL